MCNKNSLATGIILVVVVAIFTGCINTIGVLQDTRKHKSRVQSGTKELGYLEGDKQNLELEQEHMNYAFEQRKKEVAGRSLTVSQLSEVVRKTREGISKIDTQTAEKREAKRKAEDEIERITNDLGKLMAGQLTKEKEAEKRKLEDEFELLLETLINL